MNHDTVDGPVKLMLTDIVTYDGETDNGLSFSFQQIDDSPLVSLTASGIRFKESDSISPGQRMVIYYHPLSGVAYKSGEIELVGASPITSGKLASGHIADFPEWNRDRVYVYSMWRTGQYMNLHCRLTYSTVPRTFALMVDSASINDSIPQLYVLHQLADPTDYHDREYYVSWDMDALWKRQSVKGVDIHVANSNMPQKLFTFRK